MRNEENFLQRDQKVSDIYGKLKKLEGSGLDQAGWLIPRGKGEGEMRANPSFSTITS